jgi:hypothetical protein
VLPAGLLKARMGQTPTPEQKPDSFSNGPAARAAIEKLAMEAVMVAERMLGNEPRDVSAEKRAMTSRAAIRGPVISASSRSRVGTRMVAT